MTLVSLFCLSLISFISHSLKVAIDIEIFLPMFVPSDKSIKLSWG